MKQDLTVSVCMITYNHEKFITQAIISVLEQECEFEIELILMDDYSTDSTSEVINSLLENHPKSSRVKYIRHEKNIGVIPNFIQALKKCNGKYIALCDGDDYWIDPLKLQKQVNFLNSNNNYIACFHNAKIINQKKEEINYHEWSSNKDINHEDIIMNGGGIFPTAALVYRNVLNSDSFLLNTKSGDSILAFSLVGLGQFYFFKEFMCVYRKHDEGVYTSLSFEPEKRLEDIISNIYLLSNFRKTSKIKLRKYYNKAIRKQLQRISNSFGLRFILSLTLRNEIQIKDCFYYLLFKIIK